MITITKFLIALKDERDRVGIAIRVIEAALATNGQRPGEEQPPRPYGRAAAIARRLRTAKWLAKFDLTEPRRPPENSRGAISRAKHWGLIKAKGEGYVRTSKPFII